MKSKIQRKANARNQLFRQIHGTSFWSFVNNALKEKAITYEELELLSDIEYKLNKLKTIQFEGSKKVGLHPKRRCQYCNSIARFEADTYNDNHVRLCNKHKVELEREWSEHLQCYAIHNIKEISPYE